MLSTHFLRIILIFMKTRNSRRKTTTLRRSSRGNAARSRAIRFRVSVFSIRCAKRRFRSVRASERRHNPPEAFPRAGRLCRFSEAPGFFFARSPMLTHGVFGVVPRLRRSPIAPHKTRERIRPRRRSRLHRSRRIRLQRSRTAHVAAHRPSPRPRASKHPQLAAPARVPVPRSIRAHSRAPLASPPAPHCPPTQP